MTDNYLTRKPGKAHSTPVLWISILLSLLLSAACTSVAEKEQQAAAATTADAAEPQTEPAIVSVEPERPKIELNEDILYKLLLGEIAGQRGHLNISLENYLELARQTRDPN